MTDLRRMFGIKIPMNRVSMIKTALNFYFNEMVENSKHDDFYREEFNETIKQIEELHRRYVEDSELS